MGEKYEARIRQIESAFCARRQYWSWKAWSDSGRGRWQGGTLNGIQSKLKYLNDLHVTAIWIGPVFRQRKELNTFHGYSDFRIFWT